MSSTVKNLMRLEPILTGQKTIHSITPSVQVTPNSGTVYAATEWPVGEILIEYTDNSTDMYKVVDINTWDIDSNLSTKQTLTKTELLNEFLEYGILSAFDYDVIYGILPDKLAELRGRLLQLLALPDERYSTSTQKSAICRLTRGYLVACKLADVFGLTSYRRAMTAGFTSGDYLIPTLEIIGESNLEYVYEVADSWDELLDSAETFLIKSGFNKDLLQATNNSISSANKYKNIVRAIVLLFASCMFIK